MIFLYTAQKKYRIKKTNVSAIITRTYFEIAETVLGESAFQA